MPTLTLRDLERRIQARARESGDVSYTRKLLDRGINHCAKKFGEEAVEAAIAAVGEDRARLVGETADVLDDVEAELAARTHRSGLEEKAARKSR
jgi:phosphoribosyl-ATP pyrophosphohydrolase